MSLTLYSQSLPTTALNFRFRGRTLVKLPGSYRSDFWSRILLQISQNEQAVWHAILALSSTHRVGFVEISSDPATKLEQCTLRHLIKAVHNLHPHFSARDKSSSRVVLTVCLVFIVLDLLRGHFASAQVHLRNGLSILADTRPASHDQRCSSDYFLLPSSESIDDSISEAFFRLHAQVEFQRLHRPRSCILPPPLQTSILEERHPAPRFLSYTAAWRSLDYVMNDVFRLSADAHEHPAKTENLTIHKGRINRGLEAWLTTYTDSLPTLQLSISPIIAPARVKVHCLVLSYHTMLTIMTETSLYPNNETIFDSHTPNFTKLIGHLSEMWNLFSQDPDYFARSPTTHDYGQILSIGGKPRWVGSCDMSHTIIDIGWMIPLFYVAIKCRHCGIRRQAVQLLESTNHRDGIWDAKITACIARRVIEIEEGDFYDGLDNSKRISMPEKGWERVDSEDSVPMSSVEPDPTLPESSRIRDLEVRMEGDPLERVLLFGVWDGMAARVCIGEYNVPEQRWI